MPSIQLLQRSTFTPLHGFLIGCTLGGFLSAAPGHAQAPDLLAADIAPQPLSQALTAFARQTSWRLIYVSEFASGRNSKGAPAGIPAEEALKRLLEGSGLRFEFLKSRTVRLVKAEPARSAQLPAAGRRPLASAQPLADGLDEILITATKREEALRVVPISASVLSPEMMDAAGVKGISEVAALTPGVEYDFSTQWGSGILTNIAIRGINSNVGASTTGIYIDDAPIQARNAYFNNPYPVTFDLARVEVLRGPQGTLFGAGAEGGAVRFVTREPSTASFDGVCRAELSTTDRGSVSSEIAAAAGGPVVPGRIGARVSAWHREDGGYVDRVDPFTGATVDPNANRTSSSALRAALAMALSDTLQITPSLAYQTVHIHDTPSFFTYLSQPDVGVLRNGKLLQQPADDRFTAASVKLVQQLPGADLTAISAYFDRTGGAIVDSTNVAGAVFLGGFGNPLGPAYPSSYADAIPTVLGLHQIVLSQELRLTSQRTAPWAWVAGLFYSRGRENDTRDTYEIATPENPGVLTDDYSTDTQLAAFGQADLTISSRWSGSLGARLARTRSEFTEHAGGFAYVGVPAVSHAVATETPLTPRFGVSYQANSRTLLYVTLAKGFRIGGGNPGLPDQCGATGAPSYSSDSVWSRELGAKGTLLDDRLQFAASLFDIRWDRIQQSVVFSSCGFGYNTNTGAARSTGFDLATHALLHDRLAVGLSLSYIDVHFTQTVESAGAVIVDRGAVVGGVPSVPAPWELSASLEYHWPLGGSVGYAGADDIVHSHNPGPFTEGDPSSIGYDPTLHADPAINVLNVRLGLLRSNLDIRVSVTNALNARPTLQRFPDAPGSSLYYAYTLRPRTVGLTATQRF